MKKKLSKMTILLIMMTVMISYSMVNGFILHRHSYQMFQSCGEKNLNFKQSKMHMSDFSGESYHRKSKGILTSAIKKRENQEKESDLIYANNNYNYYKEEDSYDNNDENNDDDDEDKNQTMRDVSYLLFNDLRGGDTRLSINDFKGWEDIKYSITDKLISMDDIDMIIQEVLGGRKKMDFEQFYTLVMKFDEMTKEENEHDGEEDEETKNYITMNTSGSGEDDSQVFTEKDFKDHCSRLFNQLRGNGKRVSLTSFREWEFITSMFVDEIISEKELEDIISTVAEGKRKINFEEFFEIVSILDDIAEEQEDRHEEEKKEETEREELEDSYEYLDEEYIESSDGNNDLEIINDRNKNTASTASSLSTDLTYERSAEAIFQKAEEEKERKVDTMLRSIFKSLSNTIMTLSLKNFNKWDKIKDLISRNIINEDTINSLVLSLNITGDILDYNDFKQLVLLLDEAIGRDTGLLEVDNIIN